MTYPQKPVEAPDNQRCKHISVFPGGTETTIYIGDLVEKVAKSGVTNWGHYIHAPTGAVAVYIRKSSGIPAAMAYYLTKEM